MTEEAYIKLRNRLNHKYKKGKDPWGYEINPEDAKRKMFILNALKKLNIRFDTALDIGCGEGFITRDLPAQKVYGFDISDVAMTRMSPSIIPLQRIEGRYDLVLATGVLYKEYDCEWIFEQIKNTAKRIILICNIKHREKHILKNPIYEYQFRYREFIERLAIYDLSVAQCWCDAEEPKLQHEKADKSSGLPNV